MTETMPEQPADPGWQNTDDGCHTHYKPPGEPADLGPGFRCEGDVGHVERGEPHTVTLTWFDPVPEPDCAECSDTGQVAGEPCPQWCARAKWLAGVQDDADLPMVPSGQWGDDDA